MTNVKLTHPRRSRLRAWLETGDGARITQHVETCERCALTLEQLSEEVGGFDLGPGSELGDAIRETMSPPLDLNERVMRRIEERRLAERELSLLLGLIAIPRDAVDLMMPPERQTEPSRRREIDPPSDQQREESE